MRCSDALGAVRRVGAEGVWHRLLRAAVPATERTLVAEGAVPDPGFAGDRGQALPSFAKSRVSIVDEVARMKEVPDPSGAAPARLYAVTRGNVSTMRTPPATFSAATVPPILAM